MKKFAFYNSGFVILVIFILVGCGSGGGTPSDTPTPTPSPTSTPNTAPTVSLTGSKANLLFGESLSLTWASNNTTSIQSNFTAIGFNGSKTVTPTTATNYSVTVTGAGGQQATANFAVTVATVAISVTPPSGVVPINQSLVLTASVTGAVNTGVTWSIQETNGGTITPSTSNPTQATYIAPSVPGVYHVLATSNADPSKTATVVITMQSTSGTVTIN
jgi:hypothetical protein